MLQIGGKVFKDGNVQGNTEICFNMTIMKSTKRKYSGYIIQFFLNMDIKRSTNYRNSIWINIARFFLSGHVFHWNILRSDLDSQNLMFYKPMPSLCFRKYCSFLWTCLSLGWKLTNFVSLDLNLHYRYCCTMYTIIYTWKLMKLSTY